MTGAKPALTSLAGGMRYCDVSGMAIYTVSEREDRQRVQLETGEHRLEGSDRVRASLSVVGIGPIG